MDPNIKQALIAFGCGLAVGLLAAGFVWVKGVLRRRELRAENQRLKDHLHTQMEVNAKGMEAARKEQAELTDQAQNLRTTLASLSAKPDREKIRTLHLYDKAIHLMYEKSPGFAPAWESVLKEAEAELAKSEKGLIPLVKKVFRPALGSGATKQIDSGPAETGNSRPAE